MHGKINPFNVFGKNCHFGPKIGGERFFQTVNLNFPNIKFFKQIITLGITLMSLIVGVTLAFWPKNLRKMAILPDKFKDFEKTKRGEAMK